MTQADTIATASAFLRDLQNNNSKPFWSDNKPRFDRNVADPFAAVLNDLDAWGPFKVFRMNRDVRFSTDKSPYKTMHGAVAREGGARYVHLDPEGLLIVSGFYMFSPDQLKRYREAVLNKSDGPALSSVIDDLRSKDFTVDGGGSPALKSAPRSVDPDHPLIELLRLKGLVAYSRLPAASRTKVPVSDLVSTFWNDTNALADWLQTKVGQP